MRRVAVSLRTLGFASEHTTRSVFVNFDALRTVSPLGRMPALVLDDGEVLIDSAANLDWLDHTVGSRRTLIPPAGPEHRRALRPIALATGAIDKVGAAAYERLIRPSALRWPEWIECCRTQGAGVIAALAAEPWPSEAALDQARITAACMLRCVQMVDPNLLPPGRSPALDGLAARCELLSAFQATCGRPRDTEKSVTAVPTAEMPQPA